MPADIEGGNQRLLRLQQWPYQRRQRRHILTVLHQRHGNAGIMRGYAGEYLEQLIASQHNRLLPGQRAAQHRAGDAIANSIPLYESAP